MTTLYAPHTARAAITYPDVQCDHCHTFPETAEVSEIIWAGGMCPPCRAEDLAEDLTLVVAAIADLVRDVGPVRGLVPADLTARIDRLAAAAKAVA